MQLWRQEKARNTFSEATPSTLKSSFNLTKVVSLESDLIRDEQHLCH